MQSGQNSPVRLKASYTIASDIETDVDVMQHLPAAALAADTHVVSGACTDLGDCVP